MAKPNIMLEVSVVVCIYNGERTLSPCIQSLLEQTYPRDSFEIIFVDDGSSDRSAEICREFLEQRSGQAPRLTYAYKENAGLSSARNTGIGLAKGQIIAFIDQDAVAEAQWLEEIVAAFESDPQVGIVGGKINPLNDSFPFAKFVHWVHYFRPDRDRGEQILVIGTNMAFRRAVFERVGGFFANFWRQGDETAFLLKAKLFFTTRTTAAAIVRHEWPAKSSQWLRERYYNGYFYAAVPYILRQVEGLTNKPAHLLRYFLLLSNISLPLWVGLVLVCPVWPLMVIALVTWVAFGTFLWTRRRIGLRLGVLKSQYGILKAIILAPCAVGLIALGEYLRAIGFLVGLWDFWDSYFEDNFQAATETIKCIFTNSDLGIF